jgi:hypothetical protein
MIHFGVDAVSFDDLAAQLRTALTRLEIAAGGNRVANGERDDRELSDQAERMRHFLNGSSPKARTVIARHAQGRATVAELAQLVGGVPTLRGINSQISARARKFGLTYPELIVRLYDNWSTSGTEYELTPEFRAVVEAVATPGPSATAP